MTESSEQMTGPDDPMLERFCAMPDALRSGGIDPASVHKICTELRDKIEPRSMVQKIGSPRSIISRFSEQLGEYGKVNHRLSSEQGEILRQHDVVIAVKEIAQVAGTPEQIIAGFVEAARGEMEYIAANRKRILRGECGFGELSLPGDRGDNWKWLARNASLNYLRVPGLLSNIPYDAVHARNMYRLSKRGTANSFALLLAEKNIVTGLDVAEIGPGSGADAKAFLDAGAKSIRFIESSPIIVQRLNRKLSDHREKISFPSEPCDMITDLEKMREAGKKVDVFYSHSSLHYLTDKELMYVLSLIHDCLREGGSLHLAMKGPGATFDQLSAGIPIQRHVEEFSPLDDDETLSKNPTDHLVQEQIVRFRMWLGKDGQGRVSRALQRIEVILSRVGFSHESSGIDTIEDYEVFGIKQQLLHFSFRRKSMDTMRTNEGNNHRKAA